MPSAETLERFIARVEQNAHVEAIQEFYTEGASMQENHAAPRVGRDVLVAHERRAMTRVASVRSSCVRPVFANGNQVVIRWVFEFQWKDGSANRLEELACQRWEGERIAQEQFFYDPSQFVPAVPADVSAVPKPKPLMILVAGPYRSGTQDDPLLIAANVAAMTEASLKLFRAGHLPVMGEWYALPLIERAGSTGTGDVVFDEIFHPVSRRLVAQCDACLRIGGASAGADEMVALARHHGKAVYFSLDEVPSAS